jgi:hypothetical protein
MDVINARRASRRGLEREIAEPNDRNSPPPIGGNGDAGGSRHEGFGGWVARHLFGARPEPPARDAFLEKRYGGLAGGKTFVLALFTLGPVVAAYKLSINLAFAPIHMIFIAYHGSAIYALYDFRRIRDNRAFDPVERSNEYGTAVCVHRFVARPLSPAVVIIVVLQLFASVSFQREKYAAPWVQFSPAFASFLGIREVGLVSPRSSTPSR